MKKDIKRIAIVRLSALGDIVNSAVVLQFLHEKFPKAKIEWVSEEVFAPLLQNHPLIFAVHTLNLKRLKTEKSFALLKETVLRLRSLGTFDVIVDIQGLVKSAIVSRLIGKNVHGFDKDSAREGFASYLYKTASHVAYEQNIVKRNTFVVSDALGFTITDEMLVNKEPIFPNAQLRADVKALMKENKKNIALVIGASWESKKYPKENMAALCDALEENCIIIWGSEAEKQDGMWICEHSSFAKLAPKLSLNELIDLISSVDLLIGGDTGPTHMAWAQNIPSITLFGPTTSRMMYETPKNIAIKSPSVVYIFKINQSDFSIEKIEVDVIANKAKELLRHGI